jgi:hypothetical protein
LKQPVTDIVNQKLPAEKNDHHQNQIRHPAYQRCVNPYDESCDTGTRHLRHGARNAEDDGNEQGQHRYLHGKYHALQDEGEVTVEVEHQKSSRVGKTDAPRAVLPAAHNVNRQKEFYLP